jgi:hypothetical protein
MLKMHTIRRTFEVGACGVAMLLSTSSAGAAEKASKKAVCTPAYAAYKAGQEQEKAGHLRAARDSFQTCAQVTSCTGLAPKCGVKYSELASQMPSVVPVVTDEAGSPRVDVQVKVDGETLCSQLDGKGLPVEPGVHEFSFSTERGVFATQKVMIVEGQRNRPITVSMRPTGAVATTAPVDTAATSPAAVEIKPAASAKMVADEPASDSEPAVASAPAAAVSAAPLPRKGPSTLTYVFGAAGIVGLGAGAALTFWGKKDNDALSQCKPSCSPASVDHIRTLYIASDISLGVGAAALGVAAVLYATTSRSGEQPTAPKAAYSVDVHPVQSGAVASVSGAF